MKGGEGGKGGGVALHVLRLAGPRQRAAQRRGRPLEALRLVVAPSSGKGFRVRFCKGFRVRFLKGSAPSSTLQIDFPAFIAAPAGEEYQGFTLLFWRGSLPANEVAVVAAIEAKRVFVIERNVGVGR